MARRRSSPQEGETSPAGDTTPPAAGDETQIEVKLKGTADDVTRRLGGERGGAKKVEQEESQADPEKESFIKNLRNAKYAIRVKRVTPREFKGQKTNVEVWSAELPLTYQEIREEVTKTYGGGKYRVAIIDAEKGTTISADTFEVDGNPLVEETELTQEEQDEIFLQGRPKSAAELSEEGLERTARLTAKQIEVTQLQRQLSELKGDNGRGRDDTRIETLERRLIEAKHQAELEARDRKHAEEMRELKALIAQNARPAKSEGQSELALMLQQMRDAQASSDKRFEALQKQMQDDKLNAILQKVESMNKPVKSGSLLEDAEAMLKLKKLFGWGGDDDGDDDDDADDDRPWWEKALEKLGDKILPKLMAKFDGLEGEGKTVTREQFLAEIASATKEIEDQAVANAQAKIAAASRPALPAPPPATRPPAPPPAAPVSELPPPPPVSTPAASAPPPAPPAPAAPVMTVAQEIAIRVSGVLEMLSREIELRPNEYLWNYEGAWQSLPESVLEKVCAAPDAPGIVDALTAEGMDTAKLSALKEQIAGNPRILAWVTKGLNELKGWWAEKQKDPDFDPYDEDGEEGEE